MKYFLTFILLSTSLFAQDVDIEFYSIFHAESESMLGKDTNTTFPKEQNSFSSLYANLSLTYDISDTLFVVAASKGNYVLGEKNYVTPLYLRSILTSKDINKVILSELSLNYDDGFYSVSLGRTDVDFDWINGSVDGAIMMIGDDNSYSLRFFWLENFTQLQYNYYVKFQDINKNEGMYGSIATLKHGIVNFHFYDYYMKDLRNMLGANFSIGSNRFSFNSSYTATKALSLALYDYDESFTNASLKYQFKRHLFEIGASLTGENGLLAMLQLGNFMFGQFYLSNQVDRESAKNAFTHYTYANRSFKLELLGGYTKYNNSFKSIQKDLTSQELDIYLSYAFNKKFMLDFGVMAMQVDERDPIGVSQTLIMTNMVYKYESY